MARGQSVTRLLREKPLMGIKALSARLREILLFYEKEKADGRLAT